MLRLSVKIASTNGDAGRGTDRAHNVWPKHGSTPCIPSINCLFIYFKEAQAWAMIKVFSLYSSSYL